MTDRLAEPRRAVPMKLQRDLALQLAADLMRKLGMVPVDVPVEFELDHTPALCLREIDPATGEHIPHQHDPSCLIWRTKEAHAVKTHGPGGEKRITTAGSDQHAWRKADRLAENEAQRRKLDRAADLLWSPPEAASEPPKRKWGGPGFRPAKPQRRASGYQRKGV